MRKSGRGIGDRLCWVIEQRFDKERPAFLFWNRMPIAKIEGDRIVVQDQRFKQRVARGNFNVELKAR